MNRNGQIGTAWLCAAVALLAAVAAAIGIFARGDGTFVTVTSARGEVYEMATTGVYAYNARQVVAEGIGWDVFTLFVAAPALLIVAPLVARGSFRGQLAAAGMLGYFLYMYLEYSVTWALGPLFGLFIVIYAGSLVGLIAMAGVLAADGIRDRFSHRFPSRPWAALSLGMSALLVLLWVGRIAQGLSGRPGGALHGETTMTIQALDLGLVVPIAVLTAVLALRRHPAGLVAAAAYVVTFVAMSAAIASMMVSSWIVTGVLQMPPIVVFGAATLAALAIGHRMYTSVVPTEQPAGERQRAPSLGAA